MKGMRKVFTSKLERSCLDEFIETGSLSRVHRDWVTFNERNVAQSTVEILYLIPGVIGNH